MGKSIKTKNVLVVAYGLGRDRTWKVIAMRCEIYFWHSEKVLKFIVILDAQLCGKVTET